MNAPLVIRDLAVSFNRWGTRVNVFDSFSFDVPSGQWLTIVGHNGGGKSTLLRAIAGQVGSTGKIHLGSTALHSLDPARRATRVFLVQQDPTIGSAAALTCVENLIVACDNSRRLSARALRADLFARLDTVGLGSRANQLAGQLSGGERQLLTLLMAELRDAPLLLFDEPLSALDPANRARCIELIKHLHDTGRTIIQVTHDLEYAAKYGERTVVLKGGVIAFESSEVPRPLERLREELYT